jgi:hypothetical protein
MLRCNIALAARSKNSQLDALTLVEFANSLSPLSRIALK